MPRVGKVNVVKRLPGLRGGSTRVLAASGRSSGLSS